MEETRKEERTRLQAMLNSAGLAGIVRIKGGEQDGSRDNKWS